MIPNALSSTGPYAGLWSHLKAIDHALGRALDVTSPICLTQLDRERLSSLVDFLQRGAGTKTLSEPCVVDLLSCVQPDEPDYASSIDLRKRLDSIDDFVNWRKASKMGFEGKLQKLLVALQDFVAKPPTHLFPKYAPSEELEVLRAIVRALLSDAEAALQF